MDVSRAERSDDEKIRQYEYPSADPCPLNPPRTYEIKKPASPLPGKKAKKSIEMCDLSHTGKKIYLDLTGILHLPGGCMGQNCPFERLGDGKIRERAVFTRCEPLLEARETSSLPPTEEQARVRRLRLRPPMTRKELGRGLWVPLGL